MNGTVILLNTNNSFEEIGIDFEGDFNKAIHELIGNGCTCYQVIPCTYLNLAHKTSEIPIKGKIGYVLLCDDDGKFKANAEINQLASTLYASPYDALVGNVVLVGITQIQDNDKYDFCGLDDNALEFFRTIMED